MLIEPLTSFIVPTMYCGYMEFKMRIGLQDECWTESEDDDRLETKESAMTHAA